MKTLCAIIVLLALTVGNAVKLENVANEKRRGAMTKAEALAQDEAKYLDLYQQGAAAREALEASSNLNFAQLASGEGETSAWGNSGQAIPSTVLDISEADWTAAKGCAEVTWKHAALIKKYKEAAFIDCDWPGDGYIGQPRQYCKAAKGSTLSIDQYCPKWCEENKGSFATKYQSVNFYEDGGIPSLQHDCVDDQPGSDPPKVALCAASPLWQDPESPVGGQAPKAYDGPLKDELDAYGDDCRAVAGCALTNDVDVGLPFCGLSAWAITYGNEENARCGPSGADAKRTGSENLLDVCKRDNIDRRTAAGEPGEWDGGCIPNPFDNWEIMCEALSGDAELSYRKGEISYKEASTCSPIDIDSYEAKQMDGRCKNIHMFFGILMNSGCNKLAEGNAHYKQSEWDWFNTFMTEWVGFNLCKKLEMDLLNRYGIDTSGWPTWLRIVIGVPIQVVVTVIDTLGKAINKDLSKIIRF